MLMIYVDADACPVKDEVYRVAVRCEFHVRVVANSSLRTPAEDWVELITVGAGDDVADDWIAEHAQSGDIVITADIPLAARCLEIGARVVGTTGKEFTEDSIGSALAGRGLAQHMREIGLDAGGPAPLTNKDRSRFLNTLDNVAQALLRDAAKR